MKLLLSMFMLVLSLGASAADGWMCIGETPADTIKLEKLKLGKPFYLSAIQVLSVNGKYCKAPHAAMYAGMCKFKGHTLSVGLGPVSEITTKKGEKISVLCEVEREVGPVGVGGGSN